MGYPAYASDNLLDDLTLATDLTITGGEDATYDRENLNDGDVANPFRSTSSTALVLEFDLGSVQEWDLITIHGHNFDPATTTCVIKAGPSASPTAVVGSATVEAGDFFFLASGSGASDVTISDNWDTASEWNEGTHSNTAVASDALVLGSSSMVDGPLDILIICDDTGHGSATNTQTALENKGHTVTLSVDTPATVAAIDFSLYDVVIFMRLTYSTSIGTVESDILPNARKIRERLEAGQGVVYGFVESGATGTGVVTTGEFAHLHDLVDNTAGTSDNEINIVDNSHPITSVFSTGALAIMTGSNFATALKSGEAYSGTQLATGDPDGTLAGLGTLFAVAVGDTLKDGREAPARCVYGGLPYGGQTAYSADGETLLDRMVRWAAGVQYATSGTWQSASIALDGITSFSSSQIDIEETHDSTQSVTVQVRIGTYASPGTWQTVTDGDSLPGLTPNQDLTGYTLDVRATLTTTDPTTTPQVTSISVSLTQSSTGTISSRYVRVEISGSVAAGSVASVLEIGEFILAKSITLTSQFQIGFDRPVDEERIRHRTQRGVIKQRDLYNLNLRRYTFSPLSLAQMTELLTMHNAVRANPFVWIEDVAKTTVMYGRKQDDFDCENITVNHFRVRLEITSDSKGVAITG